MDFADIKNDIAFRKIFGNEQKTAPLISFLNAALQLHGDERVVSVLLANPYQFPRIAGEKATILDVRATDQSGRKFVVEMQVADKKGFDKRVHSTELSIIPDFAQTDEGLNTAFMEADRHNWTKEERIAYDNVTIKEGDDRQEKIKVAEQAKEEKEAETVIKLHKKGKTDVEIADLLDVLLEKVHQIIRSNAESGK